MHSIKVVLRKEKENKSTGEMPLCFRITNDRQHTYKTIAKLHPIHWDENKRRVKKSHPGYNEINALIIKTGYDLEKEMNSIAVTTEAHGVAEIRNKIKNRSSLDIFEYAKGVAERRAESGKIGTARRDESVLKHFTK